MSTPEALDCSRTSPRSSWSRRSYISAFFKRRPSGGSSRFFYLRCSADRMRATPFCPPGLHTRSTFLRYILPFPSRDRLKGGVMTGAGLVTSFSRGGGFLKPYDRPCFFSQIRRGARRLKPLRSGTGFGFVHFFFGGLIGVPFSARLPSPPVFAGCFLKINGEVPRRFPDPSTWIIFPENLVGQTHWWKVSPNLCPEFQVDLTPLFLPVAPTGDVCPFSVVSFYPLTFP